MKLEFFQRKFWTACRQVTRKQPLALRDQKWAWSVKTKSLMFRAQCTALDGKCTISCDNQVRKVTYLWFLTVFCRASVNISPPLPFWQDINCYLIDNNGFILVTEEQSQVTCSPVKVMENIKLMPGMFSQREEGCTLSFTAQKMSDQMSETSDT